MAADNAVSFMTPVAAAGIELMSSNAEYQTKLRAYEAHIAQNQTKAQSLAVENQADAIHEAGQQQANTYYAQGAQSIGSAVVDGGQAAGNFAGNFAHEEGPRGTFAKGIKGICGVFGGRRDGELQQKTETLAKEVNGHEDLLREVDEKLNSEPTTGRNAVAGNAGGGAAVLPDPKVRSNLERNFRFSDNRDADKNMLDTMRNTPAKDANGAPIGGKTELDIYRKQLRDQIDDKHKIISGNQSEIQSIRQVRKTKFDLLKELGTGVSNMYQAGYAKKKAEAEADSTQWGFNKEMGGNVFGAASQAMSDCNRQTEQMIDGITGALRHVVGG